MAVGWEGFVHVSENSNGWDDYTTSGGISIDADSVNLQSNEDIRQFNDRMTAERHPHPNTFQTGVANPGGDIVFNPTVSELPMFLMNTFQAVGVANTASGTVKSGTFYGTLLYAMIRSQPDSSGSTWGSVSLAGNSLSLGTGTVKDGDIYPLDIQIDYGNDIGTNARFMNCVADSLQFTANVGANLSFSYSGLAGSYESEYTSRPTATFLPNEDEFADWGGTLTIDGQSYDIDNFNVTIPNSISPRMRLGKRFPSKLRIGNDLPSGAIDYELQDNSLFKTYGSAVILMHWYVNDNTWLKLHMPNAKFGDYAKEVTGGNNPMVNSIPFTAYPSGANAGTPPVMVALHGTFATRGFSCFGQ